MPLVPNITLENIYFVFLKTAFNFSVVHLLMAEIESMKTQWSQSLKIRVKVCLLLSPLSLTLTFHGESRKHRGRGGPLSLKWSPFLGALLCGILPCHLLSHLVSLHLGPTVHPCMECCFSSPQPPCSFQFGQSLSQPLQCFEGTDVWTSGCKDLKNCPISDGLGPWPPKLVLLTRCPVSTFYIDGNSLNLYGG